MWLSYVISPCVTHHVSPHVTHPVRPCMTCHTGQPLRNLPYVTPLCCQHPCDQPCQSLCDSLKLSVPLYLPHVSSLTSLGLSTLIPPRKWLCACRNSEQQALERGSQTCQIWILGREFNPKIMPTEMQADVWRVSLKRIFLLSSLSFLKNDIALIPREQTIFLVFCRKSKLCFCWTHMCNMPMLLSTRGATPVHGSPRSEEKTLVILTGTVIPSLGLGI